MATLAIYYTNGNYEEVSSTLMSFAEGYLLQSDYISCDDIEKKGVVWERAYYSAKGNDKVDEDAGIVVRTVRVVSPDTLKDIDSIVLNGGTYIYGEPPEDEEG